MNKQFLAFCKELTEDIKQSYESGVTVSEAERLAGKFLHAQIEAAEQLQIADLDSRMKKNGTKAIKAAVYLTEVKKTEKKPSDVMLSALVDTDELVGTEQDRFDRAESDRDALQNYFNIFREAHIHFRTIARGSFGG